MIHKLKLIALLLGITTAATATVRTVNNNGGAQYSDIETAVVASAIGDTVYICGSATYYNPHTTRKNNIAFIGAGFNPQKQNPVKTSINSGAFPVGNNNILIGLELFCQVNYLNGCTGLTIDRCYGQSSISGTSGSYIVTNFTMSNCIWKDILFISNKIVNGLITNTIFYTVSNQVVFHQLQAPGLMLVDHCIFIAVGAATSTFNTPPAGGFMFTNNVFHNSYTHNGSAYTYEYNFAPVALTGSTNVVSTTWPFVQAQASVTSSLFNYAWDMHILTASAAHNTGSDGTDMGIYGGLTPFNSDGEPAIPQMDIMTTTGTQFTSGSSMQINFQSSVQD